MDHARFSRNRKKKKKNSTSTVEKYSCDGDKKINAVLKKKMSTRVFFQLKCTRIICSGERFAFRERTINYSFPKVVLEEKNKNRECFKDISVYRSPKVIQYNVQISKRLPMIYSSA